MRATMWWPRFGGGWPRAATLRARTWWSNIAGRLVITTGCRCWRQSSCACLLPCLPRPAATLPRWRPRLRPRQFQWLPHSALIRWRGDSWQALAGRGGNVTGVNNLTSALEAKRFGLLRELVPQAATIGVLLNPTWPLAASQLRDMQEAAHSIGVQIYVLRVSSDREIDTAFESASQQGIPALVVAGDAFLNTRRERVTALATRYALLAMYSFRDYAVAGGLMSYGIDLLDVYRQVGIQAGRILKGAKPADLPVVQPTKFELVINLKAGKALGLNFPPGLLAIADEVIE